jgi:adenylate cyclase class IV
MKKEKVVGESKFHRGSRNSALEILKPLGLSEPRAEEIVDTYLKDKDETTRKIHETPSEKYLVEVIKGKGRFTMTFYAIDEEEKEKQIAKFGIDKMMRKKRQVWAIDGVEVAINEVEGLGGVFIEFQGENVEDLAKYLDRLGVKEQELISKPYSRLNDLELENTI